MEGSYQGTTSLVPPLAQKLRGALAPEAICGANRVKIQLDLLPSADK